jgi:hypothetical protein
MAKQKYMIVCEELESLKADNFEYDGKFQQKDMEIAKLKCLLRDK